MAREIYCLFISIHHGSSNSQEAFSFSTPTDWNVEATVVHVDSGSVLESINNLKGESPTEGEEAEERQASSVNIQSSLSSHTLLYMPPNFMSFMLPIILLYCPDLAEKK